MTSLAGVTEDHVDVRADILLRRLIRLVAMPTAGMPAGLRRRAIYWVYADCLEAGLKSKADIVLQALLGFPEQRDTTPVALAPPEHDPNMCCCGHVGKAHRLAGLGVNPGCRTGACRCQGFNADPLGQLNYELVPMTDPCICGHSIEQHDPTSGSCLACNACGLYSPYDINQI